MYTLLLKTMTKSQTSKNTQSAKQIVRQISGITSRRSVPSISGTRLAREEFDPTKEHDEMLTRLSEIKTLREELDHEEKAIKSRIRKNCSPKHVPAIIIKAPEIPRTKSGKIVELAVKQIINGEKINNKEAIANPESLKFFEKLPQLKL